MFPIFFCIHITSSHRSLHGTKEVIKSRLCAADGFKSRWLRYSSRFLSPPSIVPAVTVNRLDFVLHTTFKD